MINLVKLIVITIAMASLSACGPDPKSAAGFTLPDGDVAQGKASYISLGCNNCHSHSEVPQAGDAETAVISINLGGESTRVRTYGELVTSVINPSHRVARRSAEEMADDSGRSRMASINDVMTVTELVDLVAFLQASYTLSPHYNTAYPVYWHPEDKDKEQDQEK